MDEEDVIYTHKHTDTHNGILLRHKKRTNFAVCSNMDGLGGHYTKWNKSDKKKYCMISLKCGI